MSFFRWWQEFWHDDDNAGQANDSTDYDSDSIINDIDDILNKEPTTDQVYSSKYPGLLSWFFGTPDQENGD